MNYSTLTKEEAIRLLDESAKGQNLIVINPSLLERLVELGVQFRISEGETLEEFFDKAKEHAESLISKLPPMPDWLEYQFRRPYYEARCCLLIGLYGPAITMSAIFLERVLKWTAFCVETSKTNDYATERWEQIEEQMQFGDAIGYAKRWGLVDKALSVRLDSFRREIRNTQAHLKIHTPTKNDEFHKTSITSFESRTIERDKILYASENPVFGGIAKEKRDEAIALDVFLFVHQCTEHLFAGMAKKLEQQKDSAEGR